MKKKTLLLAAFVAAVVLSVIVAFAEFMDRRFKTRQSEHPNCVEQPSITLPLKNVSVVPDHGYRLRICGLRERAALPSVVQCYEMKDGCTE